MQFYLVRVPIQCMYQIGVLKRCHALFISMESAVRELYHFCCDHFRTHTFLLPSRLARNSARSDAKSSALQNYSCRSRRQRPLCARFSCHSKTLVSNCYSLIMIKYITYSRREEIWSVRVSFPRSRARRQNREGQSRCSATANPKEKHRQSFKGCEREEEKQPDVYECGSTTPC